MSRLSGVKKILLGIHISLLGAFLELEGFQMLLLLGGLVLSIYGYFEDRLGAPEDKDESG